MKKWNKFFLLILFGCCLLATENYFAQSKTNNRSDLEKKKEKLLKEIDETNKLLQQNQKNKKLTKTQLEQLAKKIKARQELINTINSELVELSGEITHTSKEITSLQDQLEQLKTSYAAMIRFAQKNSDKYQSTMFVFAANDFNQAVKRIQYLKEYSEHRKHQAKMITNTSEELNVKKNILEKQKSEKTSLKANQESEKKNLDSEKKEHETLLQNLTKQESVLRKQLAEKEAAKKKLESAIAAAIKKEIEAAQKKAVAAGKKNVTKENAIALSLTPEAQKLSANFSGNKGSLPWPVEQGTISEYFGSHAHSTLKGVTVKNDGIDITTNNSANVRSVFQGEVTGVINIPGSGAAIIIRHGEYLSVYSNLSNVSVSKGDKVSTKQKIGTAGTDNESGKAMMNLQIWKGFNKLDPQLWLARR